MISGDGSRGSDKPAWFMLAGFRSVDIPQTRWSLVSTGTSQNGLRLRLGLDHSSNDSTGVNQRAHLCPIAPLKSAVKPQLPPC